MAAIMAAKRRRRNPENPTHAGLHHLGWVIPNGVTQFRIVPVSTRFFLHFRVFRNGTALAFQWGVAPDVGSPNKENPMKISAYAFAALMVLPAAAVMAETPAAAPAAAAPAKVKAKAASEMKVRGTVTSVDAVAGTITLKGRKGDETISVPATASIHAGKAEAKLADIAAGSRVTVSYKNVDGKPVASAVRVMPMAAKKAAAAPAAKG
jgi:Cu/Ag efflux protein CusF